jgi:hypothetical protein
MMVKKDRPLNCMVIPIDVRPGLYVAAEYVPMNARATLGLIAHPIHV